MENARQLQCKALRRREKSRRRRNNGEQSKKQGAGQRKQSDIGARAGLSHAAAAWLAAIVFNRDLQSIYNGRPQRTGRRTPEKWPRAMRGAQCTSCPRDSEK
jgi:hypothetical protein